MKRRYDPSLKQRKHGSTWSIHRRVAPNREVLLVEGLSEPEAARFLESKTPKPQRPWKAPKLAKLPKNPTSNPAWDPPGNTVQS
jgi:hypothetical protein